MELLEHMNYVFHADVHIHIQRLQQILGIDKTSSNFYLESS